MKNFRFATLLGLLLIAFQQSSYADTCTQISNILDGEWQFDKTHTLKFERNKNSVTVYGEQIAMLNCNVTPNDIATFFLNDHLTTIYLPDQQQDNIKLVSEFKTYNLTRLTRYVKRENETTSATTSKCQNIESCIVVLPSKRYEDQYLLFKKISPSFTALVELLKKNEPRFSIETRECGQRNAWYAPSSKKITLCYDLFAESDSFIENNYRNQTLEIQSSLQTGIVMSILMHELGHAVIDIKNVPVIGNQEDAADRIATVILLELTKQEPTLGKLYMTGDLVYKKWSKTSGDEKLLNDLYSDEHPLTEQRLFNIACLAYGSNPNLFSATVKSMGLTPNRAVRCEKEYLDAKSAMDRLLND